MKRTLPIAVASLLLASSSMLGQAAPTFQVDPLWPKPLPNHWLLGSVTGVAVDAQDHVWVVHRGYDSMTARTEIGAATTPKTADECCVPAPPVLEFDAAGNLRRPLGRPRRQVRVAGLAGRHRRRRQGIGLGDGGRTAGDSRIGTRPSQRTDRRRDDDGVGRRDHYRSGRYGGSRLRSAPQGRFGGPSRRRGGARRSGAAETAGRARPQVLAQGRVPAADRQGRIARRRRQHDGAQPARRRRRRCRRDPRSTSPTASSTTASSSSTPRRAPTNARSADRPNRSRP